MKIKTLAVSILSILLLASFAQAAKPEWTTQKKIMKALEKGEISKSKANLNLLRSVAAPDKVDHSLKGHKSGKRDFCGTGGTGRADPGGKRFSTR